MMDLTKLVVESHGLAKEKGWHDKPRSDAEIVMLMVSEIAEASEEVRAKKPLIYQVHRVGPTDPETYNVELGNSDWDKTKKPEGEIVELADCAIRIADYFGKMGWDLKLQVERAMSISEGSPWVSEFKTLTPLEQHLQIVKSLGDFTDDHRPIYLGMAYYQLMLATDARETQMRFSGVGVGLLEKAIWLKHEYNKSRPYRHGGKAL